MRSTSTLDETSIGVSDKPTRRVVAVVVATIFAIGAPICQALAPFGQSAAEFASDGDQTLRAAGYAFSIWSLIYLWLAVYAVYQAMPDTRNTRLFNAVGWPSAVAIAACGAWIVASALDLKIATVVIISLSAIIITRAVVSNASNAVNRRERLLVVWPLSLLAGWLTIATAINALTVLTSFGVITEAIAPLAGATGIATVALIALVVILRKRLMPYGLPIAWGLFAVYVAERDHRPFVALGALAAGFVVGVAALSIGFQNQPAARRL
jgi:hypothetical protein